MFRCIQHVKQIRSGQMVPQQVQLTKVGIHAPEPVDPRTSPHRDQDKKLNLKLWKRKNSGMVCGLSGMWIPERR